MIKNAFEDQSARRTEEGLDANDFLFTGREGAITKL